LARADGHREPRHIHSVATTLVPIISRRNDRCNLGASEFRLDALDEWRSLTPIE
jgi:hypothetical protein